jgi:hypothetical protein
MPQFINLDNSAPGQTRRDRATDHGLADAVGAKNGYHSRLSVMWA